MWKKLLWKRSWNLVASGWLLWARSWNLVASGWLLWARSWNLEFYKYRGFLDYVKNHLIKFSTVLHVAVHVSVDPSATHTQALLRYLLLGAFEKLWRATISLAMSVCSSAWNNNNMEQVGPTRRISIQFDIWAFFESLKEIQVCLNSDENCAYFTWRPIYIFDHIGLDSS